MLAEINLLPEKKRKNYASLTLFATLTLVCLLVFLFLQNQYSSEEAEVNQLKQEDLTLQEQLAVPADGNSPDSGAAFETLANAVSWTEEYPIDFVPIMEDLRAKLPNSGYFQALQYTEADKLALSIHLEESREAAFYLNRIKEFPYFQSVKLMEMNAEEPDSAINEADEESVSVKLQQPIVATYELKLDRAKWKEMKEKEGMKDDSVQ